MAVVILVLFLMIGQTLGSKCSGPSPGLNSSTLFSNEIQCAVACAQSEICSSYLFKTLQEFNTDNGTYNTNCVFLDLYEDNLYSQIQLNDHGFTRKTCVETDTVETADNTLFVKPPSNEEIEATAASLGFDQKVDFPSAGISKFYRFVSEPNREQWWAERKCAELGGVLPLTYTVDMAKTLLTALGSGDSVLYVGQAFAKPRWMDPTSQLLMSIWATGKVDWTNADSNQGLICPKYADDMTNMIDLPAPYIVFDGSQDKFVITDPPASKPAKFACEFLGSSNLALNRIARASRLEQNVCCFNTPIEAITDGLYPFYRGFDLGGWMFHGLTQRETIMITLDKIYAVKHVFFQSRGACCGEKLDFLRVFVGTKQAHFENRFLTKADGYVECGTHPMTAPSTGGPIGGVTCGKCMKSGKFVSLQNAGSASDLTIAEVTIYGYKMQ